MKTKFTITLDDALAHKVRSALLALSHNPGCTERDRYHLSQMVQSIWGGEILLTIECETPQPQPK